MLFPNVGVEVNPALLVLLGFMVGTLSGFFGVGGGFLITGGLLVFGVPPIFAVGTGLALIMGSSLINALKHRKIGNVDSKLAALMVVGTVPALFLAAKTNSQLEAWGVEGPVIRYIYVVFLAALGAFIVYDYLKTHNRADSKGDQVSTAWLAEKVHSLRVPPHSIGLPGYISISTYVSLPTSSIQQLSIWIPIGIGFGVGFMAGLLGAGGGFILVPILIFVLGIPTTVAVGTDLFQIVITGSVGTLIYSWIGRVDLLMVVIMLFAASVGSQLGTTATSFVDGARIRVLYGITLLSASVSVALKQASETVATSDILSATASILLLSVPGVICILIAIMLVAARSRPLDRAAPQMGRRSLH